MKKLLLMGLVLAGIGWWVFRNPPAGDLPLPSPSPSSSPTARMMGLVENEHELQKIEVDGRVYRFSWRLTQPEEVTVGVNENLAASSSGIRSDHHCQILINGGFYDTNTKPLGLLINRGDELSPWQENNLLNGILGWDRTQDKMEIIVNANHETPLWWGVQAGPVLWWSGEAVPLKLTRDQAARRMIGGITQTHELFLAVVVSEDSLFGGPELNELPTVLRKIQQVTGATLASAINLDGGTASAFLTSGIQLKELKPIGSFLCID